MTVLDHTLPSQSAASPSSPSHGVASYNQASQSCVRHTSVALPRYVHSQDSIRDAIVAWLSTEPEKAAKAQTVIANSEVRQRYTVRPLDWYLQHPSVTERSAVYAEEMVALCEKAARAALDGAGVRPHDVGLIVTTSCTGVMIPSVETHLIQRMGFRPETRRMPATEMGCVAGAWALGRAHDYLCAYPDSAVLVVAAELASLTAQATDRSMANIVSATLFGDGASAAVLTGPAFAPAHSAPGVPGTGPGFNSDASRARPARIVASRSYLFPGTPELMGFDVTDSGLKIVLSPRVPRFIRQNLPPVLAGFLEDHGIGRSDLKHFLIHPGGRKVLEGLQKELSLSEDDTRFSWKVLREYGNLSSATVLVMLHHFEQEARPAAGDLGLLMAVGPGFCAELVLLQW
jgi:alkylresorcinol/alkylpyrone synthase